MFRNYLVDSPYMWWPANLAQVSLFRFVISFRFSISCESYLWLKLNMIFNIIFLCRALHEKEKRLKGGFTRLQFFLLVLVSSFAYYVIPGFFFPTLSAFSFVCYVWKDSITAHQIGSAIRGLGIGSFGLDWSTVAGMLGSPLVVPAFAIFNTMAGFFLIVYVMIPIAYWTNSFNAKKFPLIDAAVYDSNGQHYNITRVIHDSTFTLNVREYENYSKLHLTAFFAYMYGLSFATLMASLTHVLLFNGR